MKWLSVVFLLILISISSGKLTFHLDVSLTFWLKIWYFWLKFDTFDSQNLILLTLLDSWLIRSGSYETIGITSTTTIECILRWSTPSCGLMHQTSHPVWWSWSNDSNHGSRAWIKSLWESERRTHLCQILWNNMSKTVSKNYLWTHSEECGKSIQATLQNSGRERK